MSHRAIPQSGACISDDLLEQFHAMELTPPVAEAVKKHLQECSACSTRESALLSAHDDLLGRIRAWAPADRKQVLSDSRELLSPSPSGSRPRTLESPLPEGVIPGYDILSEIHRGGQGVVYRARQRSTKRDVAIKVLLEGPFASRAARRRFEREIELVAGLKHPNIVAVFDSGATTDGRQYCVMDYVDGLRLDQYVREKRLDVKGTLQLFASICEAINFAHQRGVIHRDLKPSNILVDTDASPRILDFGLAKQVAAADDPLVSITGQVVGTLPYLSPEQARGQHDQVDLRADVYALGVILYELLTGQYPYPVIGQLADVLRHIADTAPRRPSAVWREDAGVSSSGMRRCPLDDEIETISLKALSKEPQRRYQSAGELARDVKHYLAGELIEAKRDSTWYTLRKTLRKRRGTVLVGCIILALLIAWGVTTSYFYAKEKESADRARRRFDQVRELAHASMFDFHDAIADLPGATPARMLLVKNALKYLDNLSQEAGSDVLLIRELASAYLKVGDVQGSVRQSNIGDSAGAMVSYKKSLALLESIADSHPDPFVLKKSLAMLHACIGDMHWQSGDMEKSLVEYKLGRDAAIEALGMRQGDPEATRILVSRHQDIGDIELQIGHRDEAVKEFEAGLAMIEPLAQAPGADADVIISCAINYDRLASIAVTSGRAREALELYTRSLRLREAQAATNPSSVRYRVYLANSLDQLSMLHLRSGHWDESLPFAEQARDIRKGLADADPDDARAAFELSVSYDQIADIHLHKGDFESGLAQQKLALALREAILKKDPTNARFRDGVAVSYDAIGESLFRMGKFAEAEDALRQAMRIRVELIAQNPSDHSLTTSHGTTLKSLGNTLLKLNRTTDAGKAFEEALKIRTEALARTPDDVSAALELVATRDRIGDVAILEARLEDAAKVFEECLREAGKLLEIEPDIRPTRRTFAVAKLKLGMANARLAQQAGLQQGRRIELMTSALKYLVECQRLVGKMQDDKLTNPNDKSLLEDIENETRNARDKLATWTGESPTTAPPS